MLWDLDNNKNHQEEREKKILLWSSISFFMVITLLLWGFNMKNVLSGIDKSGGASFTSRAVEENKDINETIGEIKTKFEKWDELQSKGALNNIEDTTTTSSSETRKELGKNLNVLKQELRDGQSKN